MDSGSGLDPSRKSKGGGEGKFGAFLKRVEPFLPRKDLNPIELRSWAKKTGFVSDYTGETSTSSTGNKLGESCSAFDLPRVRDHQTDQVSSRQTDLDPILGRSRRSDIGSSSSRSKPGSVEEERGSNRNEERNAAETPLENEGGGKRSRDLENGCYYPGGGGEGEGEEGGGWPKPIVMKYGLRDHPPSFVPLMYYGLQHYLSLAGSLVFIPLVIVPAMDGSDKDTAAVISTMLLLLASQPYFTVISKFREIMRELQGAIIVGSLFQCILGSTGLMSLLLRFINPVVVAPTVAAVGLAFFSYGFPQAGTCVEISVPLIVLLLIFTLYLRGVSLFGHRIFRIYAVCAAECSDRLDICILLTVGGAYDYKGCNADIPSSNILINECKKHAYTMKHCRTDASNAWTTSPWLRIPYPFQWGFPYFHMRTCIIMIFVSLVSSVDSVGTYHAASMLVNARRPTRGVVSRGVALEGFCSLLAGIWGSGTGSTTLTENIHAINITKVASRRALAVGALFLIFFSFVGKLGAVLASIPQALAASVLCFIWALTVALGLSNLRYTQTASFRNITIVGVSMFLGLSIPAYFQQYQPLSSLILPSYYLSFGAASSGPFQTGIMQLDFAMNAVMSLNMVVTFLLAFVLDNTVPGSKEERGVYVWSRAEDMELDPAMQADYSLPRRVTQFFGCRCF
ncbi:hypothetical protein Bca52824_095122 [Brassica carinata]|uniref:Nucleobase-ascorbate transporter 11 n=1 Tax=Brassica carinata TaxID=52824 RepID=A0A8X7P2B7_BRACI|nr:hypothetical protein Bca52824_095122 [Brassica carinata]